MASRIEVELIAAISAPPSPQSAMTLRMQRVSNAQAPTKSNPIEPGTPGSGRCSHSSCAKPICRPSRSKITARPEPVPASRTRK